MNFNLIRMRFRTIIHRFLRIIPTKHFIKLKYYYHYKKRINLKNPRTFSEKLQWLKINNQDKRYSSLVDKELVRQYVESMIGKSILVHIYYITDEINEQVFDQLPNKFVIKATHTSGDVYICKSKHELNYNKFKEITKTWKNKNIYWTYREYPYQKLKAKYIIEELLYSDDEPDKPLIDYKIFCFSGVAKYCQVIRNRGANETIDFYDREWIKLPFNGLRKLPMSTDQFEMPTKYYEMLEVAEKLSSDFPFVRVDLYFVNSKIYFGEMTFFPQGGFGSFYPEIWNIKIGNEIKLP